MNFLSAIFSAFLRCNRNFSMSARAENFVSTYLHESSARFVHRYSGTLRVYPVTWKFDRRGRRTPAHHRRHPSGAENEEREASSKAGRFTFKESYRAEFGGPLRCGRQKPGRCANQQRYVPRDCLCTRT